MLTDDYTFYMPIGEFRGENVGIEKAAACYRQIAAADPQTGEIVRIFDPRREAWTDHFGWSTEGDLILGKTPTGRATIAAIRLNRAELVEARRAWIIAGWHPPKD